MYFRGDSMSITNELLAHKSDVEAFDAQACPDGVQVMFDGRPFMCFPDDVEVIPAEACEHGYDVACLLCGFGSIDGERVWHSKK